MHLVCGALVQPPIYAVVLVVHSGGSCVRVDGAADAYPALGKWHEVVEQTDAETCEEGVGQSRAERLLDALEGMTRHIADDLSPQCALGAAADRHQPARHHADLGHQVEMLPD